MTRISPSHRTTALAFIGLVCLWPSLESFVTRRFRAALGLSEFALSSEWGKVILGCTVLATSCILALLYARKVLPTSSRHQCAIVGIAGFLCFGASSITANASLFGPLITALAPIALVIVGAYLSIAVVAWGSLLATLDAQRSLLLVVLSNLVAFIAEALLNGVPGDTLLYVLVLCPLASSACWIAWRKRLPQGVHHSTHALAKELAPLPWPTIALVFGLICFEDIFSRILFGRHEGWPRDTLAITLVLCGGICALLAVLAWRSRTAQAAVQRSLSLLLALYMAALLVTVLLPNSPALSAERVMVAAGTGLRIYLWMLLTYAACTHRVSAVPAFLVYNALVLSLPISSMFTFSAESSPVPHGMQRLWEPGAIVSIAGIALFVVAMLAMIASSRRQDTVQRASSSPLADLTREAGLSGRETQVFELLLKGFSAKVAAQKLGVAESTVVTHTTHIYRKLKVSSRQELLQLAERYQGERS